MRLSIKNSSYFLEKYCEKMVKWRLDAQCLLYILIEITPWMKEFIGHCRFSFSREREYVIMYFEQNL